MHREGMTQVVQTRLETPGVKPPDASLVTDAPEAALRGTLLQPGTRRRGEEGSFQRRALRISRGVLSQRAPQLRAKGDQPCLAALGLANAEHGMVHVHVYSVEINRLAEAHSSTIE
jgi:hypothetical protein